ncbi:hypothetical protein [Mesorhizobium sp. M0088]|uniref:hypothetical protein n=1 Tax=Mesorhizobium sp. M0088 TaxID=2956873 RepID=UPI0033354146
MSTMWDGRVLHVVEPGTRISDPKGRKPDIVVDDNTVAVMYRSLYCTASTEAKIIAKIEAMPRGGIEVAR